MKVIIMILITTVAATKHCKDLVRFDDKMYQKEYLADGTVSKPFFMTYLKAQDKILFSEDAEPFGNTNTQILDLKTKELKEIPTEKAVVNGVSENGTIFIGQEGGLFSLDIQNLTLQPTWLNDIVFYSMLFKDNKIIFTNYPERDVYVYENGELSVLHEGLHISELTYDRKGDLYYFNKTGIYVKPTEGDVIQINALEYEEVSLVALVYDDKRDIVYATSVYGVFKIDVGERNLKRIAIKMMFDIVFDNDGNMIYSDEESIVRLKETDKTC